MNKLGFTLIELVLVILLVSVMSVTVFPRFFDTGGFTEVTFRERLIALLRLQQTKAMQQTNDTCHRVLITSARFGVTFNGVNKDCSVSTLPAEYSQIDSGSEKSHYGLSVSEINTHSIIFSQHDIYFNSLGCPVAVAGADCTSSDILIVIQGESNQRICIESQGYIHQGLCNS